MITVTNSDKIWVFFQSRTVLSEKFEDTKGVITSCKSNQFKVESDCCNTMKNKKNITLSEPFQNSIEKRRLR